MTNKHRLKIATLNVKGLNDQQKQRNTLTLLKSYNLDIIMLQETNLNNEKSQKFLKQQWTFDSIWTNKTAILSGKKEIIFQDTKIEMNGRVIITNFKFKEFSFQITNVYAPPCQQDRIVFFNNWAPQLKENTINIITGDFNTNLFPERDRSSIAPLQPDSTRIQLKELTKNFIDSSEFSSTRPFHTFFQKTRGNNMMATHLDYIFVNEHYSHLITECNTRFGNSDHLLVECVLNLSTNRKESSLWRFNKDTFKNEKLKKEVLEEISETSANNWDLCKVYIQSIIRAFRKPKAPESNIAKLNKQITQINEKIIRNASNSHLLIQADNLNSKLQEELCRLAEKWQIRSKTKWIEQGEKSTKYFFSRYKARKSHSALKEIKIPENSRQEEDDILSFARNKYAEIYKSENINLEAVEEITKSLPQVENSQNESLIQEITQEEISDIIKHLPNNKSPGSDGLTYEFYKLTEEKITPLLHKIFNQVLSSGALPKSWCKNLITLIPKKASNLENIDNWRPISLVNSDAKIFMKILANRLNVICKDIISSHQHGFVKNRSITDAALDVITVMRNQNDNSKQHWMLFVDQQKAFDRINHEFLEIVLEKMNFNTSFIAVIKNLFANQEAHILDSGQLSKSFRVERGVRQGDPISPLLYILAFEPLLLGLKNNLQGIKLGQQFFKITAYADDLTIGIGSLSDWNHTSRLLEIYEKASNAKINKVKTKLVPLTPVAHRVELPQAEQLYKVQEDELITTLGYTILPNGYPKKDLWTSTLNNLKSSLEKLTYRNLSFKGKILLSKSLILSKIWYTAYLLPPNRKQVAEINRLISVYIKNNSRMLPRYSIFQQQYEQAGLQAPIIKDMLDARILTVWIKLLSSDYFWAKFERDKITIILNEKRNISPLQALLSDNIRSKAWPTEWKPYLLAWKRAKGKITATQDWPWSKEEIRIGDEKGNEISVNKILLVLRGTSLPSHTSTISTTSADQSLTIWPYIKTISNKKKDIFWRLYHRSLPLGYRLKYIESPEAEFCIWCNEKTQTPEHFAFECTLSKEIWSNAYRFLNFSSTLIIPTTFDRIFNISNSTNLYLKQVLTWLHTTIVYEIWCCYTSTKWGNNTYPLQTHITISNNRIAKEIQLVHNALSVNSLEKKAICKYLKRSL
jgi:exonuclease III